MRSDRKGGNDGMALGSPREEIEREGVAEVARPRGRLCNRRGRQSLRSGEHGPVYLTLFLPTLDMYHLHLHRLRIQTVILYFLFIVATYMIIDCEQ